LIREWIHFIRRPEVRPHVIFLSDYDMLLHRAPGARGRCLDQHAPAAPGEACGTSGMKVLCQWRPQSFGAGRLWRKAYAPEWGGRWATGREHGDDSVWDAAEAAALYDLLEHEVIPEFYIPAARRAFPRPGCGGCVKAWRGSPRSFRLIAFVREYTEHHYLSRCGRLPVSGRWIREPWARRWPIGSTGWNGKWATLRFGMTKVVSDGEKHVFAVEVYSRQP